MPLTTTPSTLDILNAIAYTMAQESGKRVIMTIAYRSGVSRSAAFTK